MYGTVRVLKGVNFHLKCCVHPCKGLEMSQFALIFTHTAVEGVQHMLLKASMALALADLFFLYGTRGEVTSSSAESCGVSLLSMSLGLMKAGSDLCLSPPFCVDASALGSTVLFLDEKDDRGNEMGVHPVYQK